MRIYLIYPIDSVTPEQRNEIDEYIHLLKEEGHAVYDPIHANDGEGLTAWNICEKRYNSMIKNDRVDIFWDENSIDSHFDLGMAFAVGMPTKVVKVYNSTVDDLSYARVVVEMEKRFKIEFEDIQNEENIIEEENNE